MTLRDQRIRRNYVEKYYLLKQNKMTQLNIKGLIEVAGSTDDIIIWKLPMSKLFRIPFLPERYQVTEVYEVLGSFAKKYKSGMWFFLFDEDDLTTFKETLAYMGIEFLAIHEPFPAPEENLN